MKLNFNIFPFVSVGTAVECSMKLLHCSVVESSSTPKLFVSREVSAEVSASDLPEIFYKIKLINFFFKEYNVPYMGSNPNITEQRIIYIHTFDFYLWKITGIFLSSQSMDGPFVL